MMKQTQFEPTIFSHCPVLRTDRAMAIFLSKADLESLVPEIAGENITHITATNDFSLREVKTTSTERNKPFRYFSRLVPKLRSSIEAVHLDRYC